MNSKLRIAILGWGSLIWDKDEFFYAWIEKWRDDGPSLPIEFSRISSSRNGALTLVIDENCGRNNVASYAFSKRKDPQDAFADLRCREKTNNRNIGYVNLTDGEIKSKSQSVANTIKSWAEQKKLGAVVWTDLSSNFYDKQKAQFSIQAAAAYLKTLEEKGMYEAWQYIVKAPSKLDSGLREFLAKEEWFIALNKKVWRE